MARLTLALSFLAVSGLAACSERAPADVALAATAASSEHAAMPMNPGSPYAASNAGMHAAMSTADDPDPSRNVALKMTAHHRGALEMAQVGLNQGLDPEMRALAERVIADQTREIADMETYLARTAPQR